MLPTLDPTPAHRGAPAAGRVARVLPLLLGVALVSTLTACANFSGIASSAKPADASAYGLNADAPATESDWWLAFHDEQLQQLIRQAQANSPSLRAAQSRIALAESMVQGRKAQDGPQLNGELDLSRQLFSANSIYPPPFGGSVYEMGTLQAAGSWELDFFGKNRAALAASLGQVRAAQADLQAARGLLAANVARTYYQLARTDAQLQLAQRTLELRTQINQVVSQRLQAGLDTRLEQEQSHGALPDVQLQIEQLQEQRALAMNTLAALTAQPLQQIAVQPVLPDAASLPGLPATLPINLLGARADIAAARWRIEAAQQDVSAAKAQFYPNVNLTAFAGYSSIGLDKLLRSDSLQWGVGPALQLPLFDGGRLRAQLSSKTAELDSAIESYNAQIVQAVHEVSDQLVSTRAILRQQEQQAAALESAEKSRLIAQSRYQAGLVNVLSVLQAELPVLAQRRNATDLRARALDVQVQLLHAVASQP